MSTERVLVSQELGISIESSSILVPHKEEMHPLRLAENIGFFALNNFGYDSSHRNWEQNDDLDSAWNNAELGLSTKKYPNTSRQFFKAAQIRS